MYRAVGISRYTKIMVVFKIVYYNILYYNHFSNAIL